MDDVVVEARSLGQSRSYLGETSVSSSILDFDRFLSEQIRQDEALPEVPEVDPKWWCEPMDITAGMEGVNVQTGEEGSFGMGMRSQGQRPLAVAVAQSPLAAADDLFTSDPPGQLLLPAFGSLEYPELYPGFTDHWIEFISLQSAPFHGNAVNTSQPSTGTSMRSVYGSPPYHASPYFRGFTPEPIDAPSSFLSIDTSCPNTPGFLSSTPGSLSSTPQSSFSTPGSLLSNLSAVPEAAPALQGQTYGKLPLPPGNGNSPNRPRPAAKTYNCTYCGHSAASDKDRLRHESDKHMGPEKDGRLPVGYYRCRCGYKVSRYRRDRRFWDHFARATCKKGPVHDRYSCQCATLFEDRNEFIKHLTPCGAKPKGRPSRASKTMVPPGAGAAEERA